MALVLHWAPARDSLPCAFCFLLPILPKHRDLLFLGRASVLEPIAMGVGGEELDSGRVSVLHTAPLQCHERKG